MALKTLAFAVARTTNHQDALQGPDTRSNGHESVAIPSHPLRVKPAGNAYTATGNDKSAAGTFAILPDEVLIQVLESLDAAALRQLEQTCKAIYAFSRLEDLWKTLLIE